MGGRCSKGHIVDDILGHRVRNSAVMKLFAVNLILRKIPFPTPDHDLSWQITYTTAFYLLDQL
jgi:hypothetical protein